ncbi:MAG: LamG-like jellyroll fold domain-containing protein [Bacteroidia bacterium]
MKRKLLMGLLGLCLGTCLRLSAQLPLNGLVAHYRLDGDLLDAGPNAFHASAAGGSFVNDRNGQPGMAFHLTGNGDSLILPINGFTPMTGDFTITLWARVPWPEAAHMLTSHASADDTLTNFDWYLGQNSPLQVVEASHFGNFTYWNGTGYTGRFLSEGMTARYLDGKWMNLTLRRRNDTLQFWRDRFPLAETVESAALGTALPMIVGALPDRFKGDIDDIAVYGRALTDDEILRIEQDFKPYEFRYPRPLDAYPQGDTVLVWWYWDKSMVSDSVILEYSTDGGANWVHTGHNNWVEWTPHRFPLNFPVGTMVDIRVRDMMNPSLEVHTGEIEVSPYRWELVDDELPWTWRDGVGLLEYQGDMWMLGGWDPPFHASNGNTHSEIYRSSDGVNWDTLPDAAWRGRHESGWMVHDSALWLVGGDYQTGGMSDVWRSTDGLQWDSILGAIPGVSPARYTALTTSYQGNMYYMGGQTFISQTTNEQEAWRSADGLNWTQIPDVPWPGRGMSPLVTDPNDTLWLFGGGRELDRRCYNDIWKTGDGINWEQVTDAAPWSPRYWHETAYFDGNFWVLTGMAHESNTNDVWYSPDGRNWRNLRNIPFRGRHAASALPYKQGLWLFNGIDTNDSWRLRNVTQTTGIESPMDRKPTLSWHPNPTGGLWKASERFDAIEVYSISGVLMQRFGSGQEIDLGALPAGIYLVRAQVGGQVSVSRAVRM